MKSSSGMCTFGLRLDRPRHYPRLRVTLVYLLLDKNTRVVGLLQARPPGAMKAVAKGKKVAGAVALAGATTKTTCSSAPALAIRETCYEDDPSMETREKSTVWKKQTVPFLKFESRLTIRKLQNKVIVAGVERDEQSEVLPVPCIVPTPATLVSPFVSLADKRCANTFADRKTRTTVSPPKRQSKRVNILGARWRLGEREGYSSSGLLKWPVFADVVFGLSSYTIPESACARLESLEREVSSLPGKDMAGNGSRLFMPVIRLMGWMLGKVWRRLFTRVEVDEKNLAEAKEAFAKQPAIILPSHKSHVDYLMISYVCFAYGIPMPVICAGDNLNIFFLGRILRLAGCFFIKRNFSASDQSTYRTACRIYIRDLLKPPADGGANLPLEFFMEGGRSRHGKLMRAKLGMLRMVVEAMKHGGDRDCTFVPVALTYDVVPEGKDYAQQLLGKQKMPESTTMVLSMAYELYTTRKSFNCGCAYVRFAKSLSMTCLLEKCNENLEEIAIEVQRAIALAGVIPATALVATALLSLRLQGNRLSIEKVSRCTKQIESFVLLAGGEVPSTPWNITLILEQLGCCVYADGYMKFDAGDPIVVLQLSFLRNQLLHFFTGAFQGIERQILSNEYQYGLEDFPVEEVAVADLPFFRQLLRSFSLPYLEAYWVAALTELDQSGCYERASLIKEARQEVRSRIRCGELNCAEALSKDTLANGLAWCQGYGSANAANLPHILYNAVVQARGSRPGIVHNISRRKRNKRDYLPIGRAFVL